MLQPSLDLQQHLRSKGEKLAAKGLRLLQPHVVVLCEGMDSLGVRSAYYACLHESVYYSAASLVEAVDICVKAAFVFGLQYPAPANACWSYLQRGVYGITSKYDHIPSKVLELISDIEV